MTNPLENAVPAQRMAEFLSISKDSVIGMARRGEIPGLKIGRSWRFFPSEVKAKLELESDPWRQSSRSLMSWRYISNNQQTRVIHGVREFRFK